MLLIQMDDSRTDYHLYGSPASNSVWSNSLDRLNTDHHVSHQRFESLPRWLGMRFKSFDYDDNGFTLKLVGFLNLPQGALYSESMQDTESKPVHELLCWYMTRRVDAALKASFDQWLKCIPSIYNGHRRTNASVFIDYDGHHYLFYIENGVLAYERIAESSFIANGHVTPLKNAVKSCLDTASRRLAELQVTMANLTDPLQSWKLGQALHGTAVMNYVKSR